MSVRYLVSHEISSTIYDQIERNAIEKEGRNYIFSEKYEILMRNVSYFFMLQSIMYKQETLQSEVFL